MGDAIATPVCTENSIRRRRRERTGQARGLMTDLVWSTYWSKFFVCSIVNSICGLPSLGLSSVDWPVVCGRRSAIATREFGVVIFVDNVSALAKARPNRNLTAIVRDLPANSRSLLMVIAQEPTQPLATLHRLLTTRFRNPTEQQDVGLPLMIPLGMAMRNIFAQRPPQGALTKENDLRQTLVLHRPDPSLSIGIQVRTAGRQCERFDPA
jgi:hypothetical protein